MRLFLFVLIVNYFFSSSYGACAIIPIKGGETNQSYLVEQTNGKSVIRFGTPFVEMLGIDRDIEAAFARKAAELGIGPQIYSIVTEKGILISEFIDGVSLLPAEIKDPETMQEVINQLKFFHSQKIKHADLYREKSKKKWENFLKDTPVYTDKAAYMEVQKLISQCLNNYVGLCHGDLWAPNIMKVEGKGYKFIDWEYGFIGNVLFDLAGFCVVNELDSNSVLEAYFLKEVNVYKKNFEKMKSLFHLRCVLWVYKKWYKLGDRRDWYQNYFSKHRDKLPGVLQRVFPTGLSNI